MGGSFDHMHLGHKMFLNKAALITKTSLRIGITSNDMLAKKTSHCMIQTFSFRKEQVETFMKEINFQGTLEIYKIDDKEGGAGKNTTLEALVITKETETGGKLVNEARIKENFY